MQTLVCPDCQEVIHRVQYVSINTRNAGINQLAQHCNTVHVLPAMERMLAFVAESGMTTEQVDAATTPACPGCGLVDPPESWFYVQMYGRTILCCSQRCLELIQR